MTKKQVSKELRVIYIIGFFLLVLPLWFYWNEMRWMTVNEIFNAAQSLSLEERKALIKGLFERMPKAGSLAGSVIDAGDLEAGTRQIRVVLERSLGRTAEGLREDGEAGG